MENEDKSFGEVVRRLRVEAERKGSTLSLSIKIYRDNCTDSEWNTVINTMKDWLKLMQFLGPFGAAVDEQHDDKEAVFTLETYAGLV